jgi:type I site-specific restriction endonuclease
LPSIAEKNGCKTIANVPRYAKDGTKLSPDDAKRLLDEVKTLREKLPLEGKVMVRRYSGVLDRLEAVANTCIRFGTRFYFV